MRSCVCEYSSESTLRPILTQRCRALQRVGHWWTCVALVVLLGTSGTAWHWYNCMALVSLQVIGGPAGHWWACRELVGLQVTGGPCRELVGLQVTGGPCTGGRAVHSLTLHVTYFIAPCMILLDNFNVFMYSYHNTFIKGTCSRISHECLTSFARGSLWVYVHACRALNASCSWPPMLCSAPEAGGEWWFACCANTSTRTTSSLDFIKSSELAASLTLEFLLCAH